MKMIIIINAGDVGEDCGLPRILCIFLLMARCHIQSMMIIPAITVMKVMMVPVMVQKKSPLIGVSPSIQTSAMNLKPISTIIIITFHTNIIRSRSPSNIIFCQDTSNESGANQQYKWKRNFSQKKILLLLFTNWKLQVVLSTLFVVCMLLPVSIRSRACKNKVADTY